MQAHVSDIRYTQTKLSDFRAQMVEIQGVLEVEKEDQLADFDLKDFKRMGNEQDDFRRRKAQGRK